MLPLTLVDGFADSLVAVHRSGERAARICPAAEVVLAVMAWAAKMERLAINERISAARAQLEEEGRSWGRPPRFSPLERAPGLLPAAATSQGTTGRAAGASAPAAAVAVCPASSRPNPPRPGREGPSSRTLRPIILR